MLEQIQLFLKIQKKEGFKRVCTEREGRLRVCQGIRATTISAHRCRLRT
jgi:hypothetical protein